MDKFYEGMAEIFEIDPSAVTADLDLHEHTWDSLAVVSTIALVFECFDLMLEGQALLRCSTLGDIEKLIQAKRG